MFGIVFAFAVRESRWDVEDDPCDQCVEMMGGLKRMTREERKTGLVGLCSGLPERVRQSCRVLAELVPEELGGLIAEEGNELEQCRELGVCRARQGVVEELGDETDCKTCGWLVDKARGFLRDPAAADLVVSVTLPKCASESSLKQKICEMAVSGYIPMLFPVGEEALVGLDVCGKMGVCPKGEEEREVEEEEEGGFDDCGTCKKYVDEAAEILKEKKTGRMVSRMIEEVCKFMPKGHKAGCYIFSTVAGNLIGTAGGKMDSNETCRTVCG